MRFVPVVAIAALATGCIQLEMARFARVRAGPVREGHQSEASVPGVGRSCVTIVTIFPVTSLPNLGDAVAYATVGASALRNAVVRYEIRYVPLVGGRTCYVVEGEPE
jgi:hypothetical protein